MSTLIRRVAISCSIILCLAVSSFSQTAERTLGTYGYDDSGSVTSIGPDSAGLTNLYDYDSAGRLIRFIRKNVASGAVILTETFEYDAYGNLTKRTTNNVVTSLTADANTNRLTGASYNAAGDMTQHGGETYLFDPVGTLTQKSGSWGNAFYVYTADDERIGIAGPDGSWRYMGRDLDGKVLREWAAASWNGTLSWVEDYIYRDGQLAAASRPTSQGGNRHFHLDHLGTPRLITGDNRSIYADHGYYPYGAEYTSPTQELDIGHDTPEPMKFTGHERDFAGSYTGPVLDYMHARYYKPDAARFLSVDPVITSAALRNPQLWNRYAYVGNSPVNRIDPDGRRFADVVLLWNRFKHIVIKHVKKDVPETAHKSKFVSNDPKDAQKLIEKTVRRPDSAGTQTDGRTVYEKKFNKVVGTEGETNVRVITEPAGRSTEKVISGFPFKPVLGFIAGFFITGRVDAAVAIAEYVAPIIEDNGNEKIDELRQTSAFGGERRGETTADEIIYPDQ